MRAAAFSLPLKNHAHVLPGNTTVRVIWETWITLMARTPVQQHFPSIFLKGAVTAFWAHCCRQRLRLTARKCNNPIFAHCYQSKKKSSLLQVGMRKINVVLGFNINCDDQAKRCRISDLKWNDCIWVHYVQMQRSCCCKENVIQRSKFLLYFEQIGVYQSTEIQFVIINLPDMSWPGYCR